MAFLRQRDAPEPGRYGALLIVLITGYLLSAFIDAHWVEALQVMLFTVAMLLAYRHRENISRLLQGKESRLGAKKA